MITNIYCISSALLLFMISEGDSKTSFERNMDLKRWLKFFQAVIYFYRYYLWLKLPSNSCYFCMRMIFSIGDTGGLEEKIRLLPTGSKLWPSMKTFTKTETTPRFLLIEFYFFFSIVDFGMGLNRILFSIPYTVKAGYFHKFRPYN